MDLSLIAHEMHLGLVGSTHSNGKSQCLSESLCAKYAKTYKPKVPLIDSGIMVFTGIDNYWMMGDEIAFSAIVFPLNGDESLINSKRFYELILLKNNLPKNTLVVIDKNDAIDVKLREKTPVVMGMHPSDEIHYGTIGVPGYDFQRYVGSEPRTILATVPKSRFSAYK